MYRARTYGWRTYLVFQMIPKKERQEWRRLLLVADFTLPFFYFLYRSCSVYISFLLVANMHAFGLGFFAANFFFFLEGRRSVCLRLFNWGSCWEEQNRTEQTSVILLFANANECKWREYGSSGSGFANPVPPVSIYLILPSLCK